MGTYAAYSSVRCTFISVKSFGEKKHLWIAFASYRNIIASFSNLGSTKKHMQLVKTETLEVVPDHFFEQ